MTAWTPDWKLQINNSGDFADVTLANMTITSGRTNIYQQPVAGYANFEIINFDEEYVNIKVNDQVTIAVKDSTGAYVNLFGGYITDIEQLVTSGGSITISQSFRVTVLGALSKLPKKITTGVLAKDQDGDQIYTILEQVLFDTWNGVAPAETWDDYDDTIIWSNAENNGLGEIDRPGDYELAARSSSSTDVYSLVAALATSGLGYLYEDAQGRICYADSTHRSEYLAANGFTELSANDALAGGIRTITRIGDIRNKVTIQYKNNQETSANSNASIVEYGEQGAIISTSLENLVDAQSQASFYLGIRAYPQAIFDSITYEISNPELDDSDRDALLNVFMGLPINIVDLPNNMNNGTFKGFVEGWTFRTGYNKLSLSLNVSPLAFTLQSSRWNSVGVLETWNTLNASLEWIDATIVS